MGHLTDPSDEDLERLLSGLAPAGNGLDDLADLVREVRTAYCVDPGRAVEDRHVRPIVAAAHLATDKGEPVVRPASKAHGPARQASGLPKWRKRTMFSTLFATLSTKLAGAAVAATVATGGLAATGTLPAPAQTAVANVVEKVGIDIPKPERVPAVRPKDAVKEAREHLKDAREDAKETIEGARDQVQDAREQAKEARDHLKDARTDAKDALKDVKDQVEGARDKAKEARDHLKDARTDAKDALKDVKDQVQDARGQVKDARDHLKDARTDVKDALKGARDQVKDARDGVKNEVKRPGAGKPEEPKTGDKAVEGSTPTPVPTPVQRDKSGAASGAAIAKR